MGWKAQFSARKTCVSARYLFSSSARFLRVDEFVEVVAIKLHEFADLQERNCARPLQLSNCMDVAREIFRCLADVQKARLCY